MAPSLSKTARIFTPLRASQASINGAAVNWCASIYGDAPSCTTVSVFVRSSFLKVSESREYERINWNDSRFERAGYFRIEQDTYDRSLAADDPAYGYTDFKNYSALRHNIWKDWNDEAGNPIPYVDREVRPIVWYSTYELPAHLVEPSFRLVGEWNAALMSSVRNMRGMQDAVYPRLACQSDQPDAYCYCHVDPDTGEQLLPDTDGDGVGDCAGRYDPFETPTAAADRPGVVAPYDCHVVVPEGAEPDLNDPGLTDGGFNGWYGAEMVGTECSTLLRINSCNKATIADNGGTRDGLHCQERGDIRFKFLSYVDQPGTRFLGIATLRGDPVTGEIMAGDANIGGPALDGYRTFALQQYDLHQRQHHRAGAPTRARTSAPTSGASTRSTSLPGPAAHRLQRSPLTGSAATRPPRFGERRRSQGRMESHHEPARRATSSGPEGRREHLQRPSAERWPATDIERRTDRPTSRRYVDARVSIACPEGVGPTRSVTENILDQVSPFRGITRLSRADAGLHADVERQGGTAPMCMMPNEFVDDSVTALRPSSIAGWPRARLEYTLNRLALLRDPAARDGSLPGS